ncbi:hypothetical protein DL770_001037 [Monosporascus sp. CRB-9-2]|nr:hypothetical protein DL770_001037 [Monosporascus sp. CRB-9-2]
MVLALTIVGGESAYEVIDRRAMWKWLSALKQPDGGFQMSLGGEVDVRGAYCAAVIITLLNLPLDLSPDSPAWTSDKPNLFTGLADYVGRCQTFEGGISGKPDAEAHGAYAFCALACLAILDAPYRIFPSMQGSSGPVPDLNSNSGLEPIYQGLYDREGVIRYILSCGQDHSARGGMRDKPGPSSDAYHTCYVLSGLSSAQYNARLAASDDATMTTSTHWDVSPLVNDIQVFDEDDRINPIDPVYAVPQSRREDIMAFFTAKQGF